MPLRRADLHLHTRFSEWKHLRVIRARDSYTDPLDSWRRCKTAGMDFVAFTDHDTIDGALDLLSRRPELEPEIIVGEEVETRFPDTGQWIHVNVFDIDEARHRDIVHLRHDAFELVGWLREQGIFHVLNHPFQSYYMQQQPLDYIDRILDLFEFFEVANASQSSRHNRACDEMLDAAAGAGHPRKHGIGGSDAHNLRDIALACTEAEIPDHAGESRPAGEEKREWLAAVARGEGRAVGRSIGLLGLTANVYEAIWRYYSSLLRTEARRGMGPSNYAAAALMVPVCVAGLPLLLNLSNSARLEVVTARLRRALSRRSRQAAAEFLQDPLD